MDILRTYNSDPEGDILQTENLVNDVRNTVLRLLLDTYSHDPAILVKKKEHFNSIILDIMLRAKALDRIFNSPPRDEHSTERSGPSICVYDKDGELEFVNGTYLKLVGIDSGEEAKKMVREGILIDHIYSEEIAREVREFVTSIGPTGGYRGKIFPLKNHNSARWTSLSTGSLGGNVRVAEDITGIKSEDIPELMSLDGVEEIPFQFTKSLQELYSFIGESISFSINMKVILGELEKLAQIGDIIVDKGPFFVVVKEGDKYISVNKSYVAATGYSLQELFKNPKLYFADQKDQVFARINSLQKTNKDLDPYFQEVTHYHDSFRMKRKDGASTNASWDTFRISDLQDEIMTTVRIGSMIASAEEIEGEKELKNWFASQGIK